MTDNEFLNLDTEAMLRLSNEQFMRCMKLKEARSRTDQTEIAPGYADKNHEEKIGFWAGGMNQQMRWQAESGLDPYAGYSPEWRENLLRFEPDLDALIEEAFERYLNWEWSYGEYLNRVSR